MNLKYIRWQFWILGLILLVAGVLRLYHIRQYTEFLGDQGSAAVVIMDWEKTGVPPLAGPTVSTGQKPGPFYYYLIAPVLLLTRFAPESGGVFFSLLGVLATFIIYIVLRRLTNEHIALGTSALFATSPIVVVLSRNMWNPTAIPFFVIILFFVLWRLREKNDTRMIILAGVICGSLMQLHYSNIFTTLASFVFVLFWAVKSKPRTKSLVISVFYFTAGFFFVMLPFLIYEYNHEFRDILDLVSLALSPGKEALGKRAYLGYVGNILARQGQFVLLAAPTIASLVFVILFIGAGIMSFSFWPFTFATWLLAGSLFLPLYDHQLYDHYMLYLLPLPFLLLATVAYHFRKHAPSIFLLVALLYLGALNVFDSDLFRAPKNDIPRLEEAGKEMVKESAGQPYSFTVIQSDSFSDYHYRYELIRLDSKPRDYRDPGYKTLFLICEQKPCPSSFKIAGRHLEAMCFDHHCVGPYPTVDLSQWELKSRKELKMSVLYAFDRK